MVLPAVPDFIQPEQVVFPIQFRLKVRYQAPANAGRIEQDAMGILHDGKLQFLQRVSDMFGEAGTDQQYAVAIADGILQRGNSDRGKKIHSIYFI